MAKRESKTLKIVAKCQGCGAEYPERDAATEPEYECRDCGKLGYDCCVPGNNAICTDCEASR